MIRGLSWRIGLPFAAFVLAGSVALVLLMGFESASGQRARFEQMAATNAGFMLHSHLHASIDMAKSLQQVLGVRVLFRHGRRFTTADDEGQDVPELVLIPADGCAHRLGGDDVVAVSLEDGHDLMLLKAAASPWREVWRAETFAVLGVFWLLALVVGWLVARGLVRPLHHLASRLPDIERMGPLELPEAERGDEIGDVARAFVRTRTALQEARAQGQRAEKLAVLGRMTAALAHEIQNPVAAIKMHAQLWRSEDGNGTAPVIEREASRIEELLNQWLFLSRPEPPRLVAVDAGALLAQVALAHRAQLEHAQVRLQLEAPPGLVVEGDARRLGQVFANLLVNAVQAMPRGGVLQVKAEAEGGQVRVRFLDGGRGFSVEALLRFGEFFYSEREGGMGIGLSVAMEIVKAHGGQLSAANRSEGGACVTVALRRADGESP